MLRKIGLVVMLIVVIGLSRLTVLAGVGSIPVFNVQNDLNGVIQVTCPGDVGFTWRVAVDDLNNIHVEQTTNGGGFYLDANRIGNGHHNAIAQVRCPGEPGDWSQSTTSTVGFDWYVEQVPSTAVPQDSTDPTAVPQVPADGPRPLDLSSWCGQGVGNDSQRADGWYCIDGNGVKTSVRLNAACGSQYSGYVAFVQDWNNWYSVGCVPNGQGNVTDQQGSGTIDNPTAVPGEPTVAPVIIPTIAPTAQPPLVECHATSSERVGIVGEPFLRSGPGIDYPAIGWTRAKNEFTFLEGIAGWYRITCGNGEYWVSNDQNLTSYIHSEPIVVPTNTDSAPEIVATARPQFADAQSGDGIHWGIYCSQRYQTGEYKSGSDPTTYGCGNGPVDHTQACIDVWGLDRQYPHWRANELGSLTCESTAQGVAAPVHPDAQTNDHGIDTDRICKDWNWSGGSNSSQSGADVAYTIRCINGEKVMYLGKQEFDQACADAYGQGFFAQLIDPDSLGGWKCVPSASAIVATPNGVDPRATTATPIPPINPTPGPVIGPGGGYNPVGCPPALAARLSAGTQGRSTDGGTPLKMRQAPGKTSLQVGTLQNGGIFTVKAGPNCADSMNWWFIDYNGTLGWVEEGISGQYFVEPYNGTQQETFVDEISCQDGTGISMGVNTNGPVFVSFVATTFWCTEYVISRYPKLQQCWQGYPNAGLWDDWASDPSKTRSRKSCGLQINGPVNGHWAILSEVQPGDIVVWEGNCGPAIDPRGHVGIVRNVEIPAKSYPKGEKFIGPLEGILFVDEANGLGGHEVRENVPHALWVV